MARQAYGDKVTKRYGVVVKNGKDIDELEVVTAVEEKDGKVTYIPEEELLKLNGINKQKEKEQPENKKTEGKKIEDKEIDVK